jgi:hypothetical protein
MMCSLENIIRENGSRTDIKSILKVGNVCVCVYVCVCVCVGGHMFAYACTNLNFNYLLVSGVSVMTFIL